MAGNYNQFKICIIYNYLLTRNINFNIFLFSKGGSGYAAAYARGITFEQITVTEIKHPIIINQNYADDDRGVKVSDVDMSAWLFDILVCTWCKYLYSSLIQVFFVGKKKVSDVTFSGFEGTSASEQAIITLNCCGLGCTDIVMNNVNLTSIVPGKPLTSLCKNALGRSISTIPNVGCLSKWDVWCFINVIHSWIISSIIRLIIQSTFWAQHVFVVWIGKLVIHMLECYLKRYCPKSSLSRSFFQSFVYNQSTFYNMCRSLLI